MRKILRRSTAACSLIAASVVNGCDGLGEDLRTKAGIGRLTGAGLAASKVEPANNFSFAGVVLPDDVDGE